MKAARGTAFTVSGRPGVGYALDLLLPAGSLALVVLGAGRLSVDENLPRRMRPETPALRMREAGGC